MLKQSIFDPNKLHRAALYLRMSSKKQNKRSPHQQRDEIERRMKALGYKWIIAAVYCDEAKSGRYLRQRHDYQRMMREIKTGEVVIDLILVDTLERFGRVDELPIIRKKLLDEHGVLVLTADSSFTDPTSLAGQALGTVETIRATQHGITLAHNVGRGKRDAIALKHWPGGKEPFGLMLKSIMKLVGGREEVDHCILIRNPQTDWIIALLFATAANTGWGTTRLARFLTNHPDVPASCKPFQPSTIGYWLDHEIYYGELVWPKHATGIVSDQRVMEKSAPEDIARVPDFCQSIVSRELWDEVQQMRQVRRERIAAAKAPKAAKAKKQILARAPGMSVKYALSGLVFCGECGLRMVAGSSSVYATKAGLTKRYVAFACAGARTGHCSNTTTVPEEWLREVVIGKLRERLFPGLQ